MFFAGRICRADWVNKGSSHALGLRPNPRWLLSTLLVAVVGTAAISVVQGFASTSAGQANAREASRSGTVAASALPAEARATQQLIHTGGPFPFAKDGSVFGNRERKLPPRARGYYREYTVPTPKSRDRGARRIVCGGTVPSVPDACFYSDDHYASFRLIAQ